MRTLVAAVILTLTACGSVMYSNEARDDCPREVPSPLNAETCFGDFLKDRVQSTDPRGPNYVQPYCPCGAFVPGADAGVDADARD